MFDLYKMEVLNMVDDTAIQPVNTAALPITDELKNITPFIQEHGISIGLLVTAGMCLALLLRNDIPFLKRNIEE